MPITYPRILTETLQRAPRPLRKWVATLTQRWPSLAAQIPAVGPAHGAPSAQSPEQLSANWQARVDALAHKPLISVITPAYKTPERWLRCAVESLRRQYYPHWELCIVDDGSQDATLDRVLDELAAADPRVRVFKQTRNQGISAASNVAVENSRGEFLALLDHDDELTPDALYYVAERLAAEPGLDIIYSDEDKIDVHGVLSEPFYKPDFSPEMLFNYMYVGHLTVYRKALVERLGGFRSEYDFSQDYDLILRAVEATTAIAHIPRILYHWRKAEGSAANSGGKVFARKTNLAALQSALDRRGLDAAAEELPTANRVRFRNPAQPRVSLIIPSDSQTNIEQSIASIAQHTDYPDLEIVVVTNSALAGRLKQKLASESRLRFAPFDKPFNFSAKCNDGVDAATGEIVVFFNDDVRPRQGDWLTNLIEYLAVPGVGATSPKLLYENETIQHAGLVTGVRGLVGTAFHCQPADSLLHFNFAQAVRDASAISGACLAMRRQLFLDLGGFDAVNFPINHSDVDLCFRIREHGLRCVYTPYATLLHIGHLSLREVDKKREKHHKDKADVDLLKRWAGYTAYDPYYTEPMRHLLYRDSPHPIALYGKNQQRSYPLGIDALFISHELSESGAPLVLYYAVQAFVESGGFAVVLTREDGPFRARFEALGVPVICDSLLFSSPDSQQKLLSVFDVVVANTYLCWQYVGVAERAHVPLLWYLHESHAVDHLAAREPGFYQALGQARNLIVGSPRSLQHCSETNPGARLLTYGVTDFARPTADTADARANEKIIVSVLGSLEWRKGQDIFIQAIERLPESLRAQAEFRIVGRPLLPDFEVMVKQLAESLPCVRFLRSVDLSGYQELLLSSDIVVCPSRDDTLPLVTLDALGCGKALVVSNATGTMDFFTHGREGMVFASEDAAHLALCLERLLSDAELRQRMGRAARELFLRKFSLPAFRQRFLDALLAVARPPAAPARPAAAVGAAA